MTSSITSTDHDFAYRRESLAVRIPQTLDSRDLLAQTLKANLKFPEDYGTNWDAIEEAIRDLSWLPEKTILLIHDRFPALPESDFNTYTSILKEAVEYWRLDGRKKLVVVFG